MPRKKLSTKNKMFAKNLIKYHGNATEAYLETYPNSGINSAHANASRLLAQKPEILDIVKQVADNNGVTLDKLTKKLKQKLDSKKSIVIDREIQYVDDNTNQLKAVELGLKIQGALDDSTKIQNNTVNITHNQSIIVEKIQSNMERMFEIMDSRRDKLNKKEDISTTYAHVEENPNEPAE